MPNWWNAVMESTNPLWKLAAMVLVVGGTFAVTWLSLHMQRRRTERLITRMQAEAWFGWTDDEPPQAGAKIMRPGGPPVDVD